MAITETQRSSLLYHVQQMDACRIRRKTRGFFAKNTNPQLLIDFAGVKIFESATVDTNILLFSKEDNEHKTFMRCHQ